MKLFFMMILSISIFVVSPAFGEINTDKSVYYIGDTIVISGTVIPEDDVTLSLLITSSSDIVSIAQFDISGNSWTHSIQTGGQVWIPDTTYTVKATYNQIAQQTTFLYTEQPSNNNDSSQSSSNNDSSQSSSDNSSQSSNNDSSQSSNNSNNQNIFSFVDPTKDPQYYVDRYNNEQIYRDWFDSNFPGYTIYDAVGLSNPVVQPDIPPWIKEVFRFYSEGNIGDDELKQALVWLIQEDILKID